MSDNGDYDSNDGNNIIEYLVGCTWAPRVPSSSSSSSLLPSASSSLDSASSFPALQLLAGNSQGDGYIFQVDADGITPLMHLKGGHKGCIRDFSWIECRSNNGNKYNSANSNDGDGRSGSSRSSNSRLLVTGGEDARLCEWDVYGIGLDSSDRDNFNPRGSRGGEGGGPILSSGRGGRSNHLDSREKSPYEKHHSGGVVGRKGKKKFGSPY